MGETDVLGRGGILRAAEVVDLAAAAGRTTQLDVQYPFTGGGVIALETQSR